jgi:dTMP kinase
MGNDRSYLNGQRDIHEEDLDFQNKVRDVYLSIEGEEYFTRIDCSYQGAMLPPDGIFNKILNELKSKGL